MFPSDMVQLLLQLFVATELHALAAVVLARWAVWAKAVLLRSKVSIATRASIRARRETVRFMKILSYSAFLSSNRLTVLGITRRAEIHLTPLQLMSSI
jgi:hypothetical protein